MASPWEKIILRRQQWGISQLLTWSWKHVSREIRDSDANLEHVNERSVASPIPMSDLQPGAFCLWYARLYINICWVKYLLNEIIWFLDSDPKSWFWGNWVTGYVAQFEADSPAEREGGFSSTLRQDTGRFWNTAAPSPAVRPRLPAESPWCTWTKLNPGALVRGRNKEEMWRVWRGIFLNTSRCLVNLRLLGTEPLPSSAPSAPPGPSSGSAEIDCSSSALVSFSSSWDALFS